MMNNIYLIVGALSEPDGNTCKQFALEKCQRGSEKLGFTWEQITSKRRHHNLTDVRTCICKFLYDKGWTLGKIGEELKIHHATVIYHKKKFEDLLPIDREIQQIWHTILQA